MIFRGEMEIELAEGADALGIDLSVGLLPDRRKINRQLLEDGGRPRFSLRRAIIVIDHEGAPKVRKSTDLLARKDRRFSGWSQARQAQFSPRQDASRLQELSLSEGRQLPAAHVLDRPNRRVVKGAKSVHFSPAIA